MNPRAPTHARRIATVAALLAALAAFTTAPPCAQAQPRRARTARTARDAALPADVRAPATDAADTHVAIDAASSAPLAPDASPSATAPAPTPSAPAPTERPAPAPDATASPWPAALWLLLGALAGAAGAGLPLVLYARRLARASRDDAASPDAARIDPAALARIESAVLARIEATLPARIESALASRITTPDPPLDTLREPAVPRDPHADARRAALRAAVDSFRASHRAELDRLAALERALPAWTTRAAHARALLVATRGTPLGDLLLSPLGVNPLLAATERLTAVSTSDLLTALPDTLAARADVTPARAEPELNTAAARALTERLADADTLERLAATFAPTLAETLPRVAAWSLAPGYAAPDDRVVLTDAHRAALRELADAFGYTLDDADLLGRILGDATTDRIEELARLPRSREDRPDKIVCVFAPRIRDPRGTLYPARVATT